MNTSRLSDPRLLLSALVTSLLAFGLLASVTFNPAAYAAGTPKVHGVEIVPWSKKVEEGRYRSARDWHHTVKWFKKHTSWTHWQHVVNVPTIKYVHIENRKRTKKRDWDGVNIYELPSGKVYFFVLPHVENAATKVEKKK